MVWLGKRYESKFGSSLNASIGFTVDSQKMLSAQVFNMPEVRCLTDVAHFSFDQGKIIFGRDILDSAIVNASKKYTLAQLNIEAIHKFGLLKTQAASPHLLDAELAFVHLTFRNICIALI
ncbi:MAG UNVERIFIED_CONTAM: hypothetical protein LVQ98_08660 [Rickettsiaceae bacterium]